MRPSDPKLPAGYSLDILPDGFNLQNYDLGSIIMLAFYPQSRAYWRTGRLTGAPSSVVDEHYDIQARVSEADLHSWHEQQQNLPILKEMLQTALVDRCELAIHSLKKEEEVYELRVGKDGPRFGESDPKAPLPSGSAPLADGGGVIPAPRDSQNPVLRFSNVTMAEVAAFIMRGSDRAVVDKTGLRARYNLAIPLDRENGPMSIPGPPTATYILSGLGLNVRPAKDLVTVLAIDHIEKPTSN